MNYSGDDVPSAVNGKEVSRAVRWLREMLKWKHVVIGVWGALVTAGIPLAALALQRTTLRVDAVHWTQTGRAIAKAEQEFPGKIWRVPEAIMISCNSCSNALTDPWVQSAQKRIAAQLDSSYSVKPQVLLDFTPATAALELDRELQTFSEALGAPQPRNPYLSEDSKTIIMETEWSFSKEMDALSLKELRKVTNLLTEIDKEGKALGYRVANSGILSMVNELSGEIVKEIVFKEGLITPLAICVLLWQVRSWRLAGLSSILMVIALTISLGFQYFISLGANLTPLLPVSAMVFTLAMSVDYSLFIFARFREELQAGHSVERALESSMDHSGRVIALSGSIIVLDFVYCCLFVGEAVWTMALNGAVVVCVVFVAHLTLLPCCIVCKPDFFAYGLLPEPHGGGSERRGSKNWFSWGSWVVKGYRPLWVMMLLYGLMVPVLLQIRGFQPRADLSLQIPKHSRSERGYRKLKATVNEGMFAPVSVIQMGVKGDVRSDASFRRNCDMLKRIISETSGKQIELRPDDFRSPFLLTSEIVNALQYFPGGCAPSTCLRWTSSPPECPSLPPARVLLDGDLTGIPLMQPVQRAYRNVWRDRVSPSNRSVITKIEADFDHSSGAMAHPFHKALLRARTDGFISTNLGIIEVSDECYRRMPLVLGLCLLTQCIFIGLTYRAHLILVKLLLTVVVPVAFVFGLFTCVYQRGVLDWTHRVAFQASGIFWLIPIFTLPTLVGLAIDYDIFLFARVYELRKAGYNNKAAIVGGLSTTGPPITSAGLIMTIAFSGMMLSRINMNCQMGFLLGLGVLIDTYLIRGVLVPCVLSVGGFMNYWPQEMPEPVRTLEDMEAYLENSSSASQPLVPEVSTAAIASR